MICAIFAPRLDNKIASRKENMPDGMDRVLKRPAQIDACQVTRRFAPFGFSRQAMEADDENISGRVKFSHLTSAT
jgi:hypothetical protein